MTKTINVSDLAVALLAALNLVAIIWVWRQLVANEHGGKMAEASAMMTYILLYRPSAIVAAFGAGWALARVGLSAESRCSRICLIVITIFTALTALMMLANDHIVEASYR